MVENKNRTRIEQPKNVRVTKNDIEHAKQTWRDLAPDRFKTLLDADTATDTTSPDAARS